MSEDILEIVIIGGKVRCVYLNDRRIAGAKPWADEVQKVITFKVPAGEIRQRLKRSKRKTTLLKP